MSANASQGFYTPLPQSLSDSDSEENRTTEERPKHLNQMLNGVSKKNENSNFQNGFTLPDHIIDEGKHSGFAAMSLCRKIAFIFSISLCFIIIVVFLWVLPCDKGTCPIKISNWDQIYDGIELKGRINLVKEEKGQNLVLLYRSSVNVSEKGGVINVLGNNGGITWYISKMSTPSDLKCNLFDINLDGRDDCLLLGENGIEAVDPLKGEILWHVHGDFESAPIRNLEFPFILPDLNGDNVNDLITRLKGSNKFLVISGKTGIVLYDLIINDCDIVQSVALENNNFIYLCKNGTANTYFKIMASDLCSRVYNRNLVILPIKISYKSKKVNYYVNNGYKLQVKNIGKCPMCFTNISLFDVKTNKILRNYHYSNTYTMKPTQFSFKPTKTNLLALRGHINGFILKLWQWPIKTKYPKQFVNFDQNIRLIKRNIPITNTSLARSTIISERVVLMLFNDTDIHVTNSSSTEIVQYCFQKEKEDIICQPDLANQEESMLIDDLDGDGLQELISFSSSFDMRKNHRLISNIKVICLEEELPKLYDMSKK